MRPSRTRKIGNVTIFLLMITLCAVVGTIYEMSDPSLVREMTHFMYVILFIIVAFFLIILVRFWLRSRR